MKCKKHPTYKALHKPKADCPTCRHMRLEKLNAQLQPILAEIGHLNRMSLFEPSIFPKGAGNTVDGQYYERRITGRSVLYRVLRRPSDFFHLTA